MYGKDLRLSRLLNSNSKTSVIVPLDHGVTLGPISGLEDIINTITKVINGGANAVVLHKGILSKISNHPELAQKGRYIMHISSSTIQSADPSHKVLVASVEEAVKLGADGISIQINLGTDHESEMIKDLGTISKACFEWGMPLLVMAYSKKTPSDITHISHAARVAEELGADIVKVGPIKTKNEIENILNGVTIPVVIAGGEIIFQFVDLLKMINENILAGASGVAIGRNIFQSDNCQLYTELIVNLVHKKKLLEECISEYEKICVTK